MGGRQKEDRQGRWLARMQSRSPRLTPCDSLIAWLSGRGAVCAEGRTAQERQRVGKCFKNCKCKNLRLQFRLSLSTPRV